MIDEKHNIDLMIYVTRYVHSKSIKTGLHYHELMGKIMKEKRYLMVDDYRLDKVLYIIKEMIVIKKFDNTKMLVDTDDRLPGKCDINDMDYERRW